MKKIVGIDLGTTNSVVAYVDENGEAHAIPDETGSRITPSVIYFPRGEDRMEIGALAAKQAVIEPDRVAQLFKRGMGSETFLPSGEAFEVDGKELRPEVLSSFLLRKLVNVASAALGEEITDVVITRPAYFGESEIEATRAAGELAGLNVHLLPAEPMAAAVAFGIEHANAAQTVLVFDLGGGTFDVTVLRQGENGELSAVAHEGDRHLGGADFDRLIVNLMASQAAKEGVDIAADPQDLASAFETAEIMKKELSSREQSDAQLIAGGKRIRFSLSRNEFNQLIADAVEDTELTVERALEAAEIEPSDVDIVLMVGGSSRIPAFAEMLTKYFGKEPRTSRNLDEDVARGAALMGTIQAGTAPQGSALSRLPPPQDISSHGLGVSTLSDGTLVNSVLLPAGTPLPLDEPVVETFATSHDGQTQIELTINEGDNHDLRFVEELGSGLGELGEPKPEGYPITVQMSLDKNGIVRVAASDGVSGRHICDVVVERRSAMSASAAAEGQDMLATYEVL